MTRYEVFSKLTVLESSLNNMKAKVKTARAGAHEKLFINLDNLLSLLELTFAVALYKPGSQP